MSKPVPPSNSQSASKFPIKVELGIEEPVVSFLYEAGILFINLRQCLCYVAQDILDMWRTFVGWAFSGLGSKEKQSVDSSRWKDNFMKVIVQTALVGFDSLGMSILICVIAGSVLALQTADKFAQTGADAYVGGLVALAVVREIGPIFTCLAVGARAGTAIAAEIANMKVTEQVDALRVMRVDPVRYLMLPRVLACVIALPMLTVIGEIVAIVGGMLVAQAVTRLHYHKYLESVWLHLKPSDLRLSILKAAIFGLILASISCTVGLSAKGGARDVGLSTTKAVVWISIVIIIADFFLTWIFFGTDV